MSRITRRTHLACATVCAIFTVVLTGAAAATAAPTSPQQQIFTEMVKPSDSITIPGMLCPTRSYLESVDYSPGRIVPRGVEVIEPGGVGVTIAANWEDLPGGIYATGTNSGTATNWDPVSPHEVTVKLHCTTDQSKAFKQPVRRP